MTRLGRYQLDEPLGSGGMAVVYRARDPALDRVLAIKVMRPLLRGPAAKARLLREAQAMARLEHPAVVPIFDVGVEGDEVYLVMPLLGGGTLGDWIHAAPRPWRAVLDHFLAAGRGLAAAHAAGIVHRDFKPDNVLLGAGGDVRVGDFGLAYSDELPGEGGAVLTAGEEGDTSADDLTATGVRVGTPAYMAPEQLAGRAADARSDQFGFCVSLWEGLYGDRPFRADGTLMPVPAAREVPAWLHTAVLRGLRPDPAARWPSMDALLGFLEGHKRRRAQVGVALGVGVPVAIVVAAISVGAAGGGRSSAPVRRPWRTAAVYDHDDARVEAAALSPDGTRVAFVADGKVMAVPVTGGEPGALAGVDAGEGAGGPLLLWLPDGGVLVSGSGGAVVWHAAGRAPRRLGTAAAAAVTAGGVVALSDGSAAVRWIDPRSPASSPGAETCRLDGDVRRIAALAAERDGPAGQAFALVETSGGAHHIVTIDRSCRELRRVAAPAWASGLAAVNRIVYYIACDDPRNDDAPRRLVALAGDGRLVEERALDGLVTGLAGVTAAGDALVLRDHARWRVGELGERGERVADHAGGLDDTEVKVAPDGRWVATIEDDHGRVLRVGPLAGPLGEPIARDVMTVTFAPDGERLAAVLAGGGRAELVVMDRGGTITSRAPVGGIDQEDGLVWDGGPAVIATAADARNLLRVELASGTATPLLDGRGTASEPEVSLLDGAIAFLSARDGRGGEGVWLRDPAGKVTRLRAGLVSTLRIAFAPGGEAVLVHDLGAEQIWRFDRRGKSAPLFTAAVRPGERLTRLFPTRDGRIYARVDARTTGIYASVSAAATPSR